MNSFDDKLSVAEGLKEYFKLAKIDPVATYEEKWAKIDVGPFYVFIPNTETRKKELRLHDIHHVATGYPTTWTGEAQISAWEIGSGGCGFKPFIWGIILGVAGLGLVINPRETLKAFKRGRSGKNLFGRDAAEFLDRRIGELRSELGLV